jgi:hypothetical protein
MREFRGNHPEKLGLERILCASQFTIRDMAGTSSVAVSHYTNTWSSQHNQVSRTPYFTYPLVIRHIVLIFIHISLFLVHNSTIIAELIVKFSPCISPCHDPELPPSTISNECTIHPVWCSPSPAYTQYGIRPRLISFPSFS